MAVGYPYDLPFDVVVLEFKPLENLPSSTILHSTIYRALVMEPTTFSCGGHYFAASSEPVAQLSRPIDIASGAGQRDRSLPVTIIVSDKLKSAPNAEALEEETASMLQHDDVFNAGFLEHVIFCTSNFRPKCDKVSLDGSTILPEPLSSRILAVITSCMTGSPEK